MEWLKDKQRIIVVAALIVIAILLSITTGALDWFLKSCMFAFFGIAIFLAVYALADWFIFEWLDRTEGRYAEVAKHPLALAILTAALLVAIAFVWNGIPK